MNKQYERADGNWLETIVNGDGSYGIVCFEKESNSVLYDYHLSLQSLPILRSVCRGLVDSFNEGYAKEKVADETKEDNSDNEDKFPTQHTILTEHEAEFLFTAEKEEDIANFDINNRNHIAKLMRNKRKEGYTVAFKEINSIHRCDLLKDGTGVEAFGTTPRQAFIRAILKMRNHERFAMVQYKINRLKGELS